jgi:glycerol-3-phosphate dehydrogenase (NAD(P)+)
MKACVIGAGAWGTALALVLVDTGYDVTMWDRNKGVVDSINRGLAPGMTGVQIPPSITACQDPARALQGTQMVVSAISSPGLPEVTRRFANLIPADATLVTGTKGLEPETLLRPSEAWIRSNPSLDGRVVAISGPNFAIEIAKKLPAATVVASKSAEAAMVAQSAFMTPYLRAYTHWDIAGVELGGSLKNIIALACGMAEGLGVGYNAQAAIISRGIAEVTRLGVALGADPLTFAGLSGVGDLVLTSTGHLSRNRQAGIAVGKGESMQSFIARTGYTVEGFVTVEGAIKLAHDRGITMPITEVVYRILYLGMPIRKGLADIMSRDKRPEHE